MYLKPRWLRIHRPMVVSNRSATVAKKTYINFFQGEAPGPLSTVFNNLGFLGGSFLSSSSWSPGLLLPGLFMLFLEPIWSLKAQCPYLLLMLEFSIQIFTWFNHKPQIKTSVSTSHRLHRFWALKWSEADAIVSWMVAPPKYKLMFWLP